MALRGSKVKRVQNPVKILAAGKESVGKVLESWNVGIFVVKKRPFVSAVKSVDLS